MKLDVQKRRNIFLFITFSFTIGYSTLILLLPLYMLNLGASQTQIGFLSAMYTLPSFLIPIIAGTLADKYGRAPLILVALIGFTLLIPLFTLAQGISQVLLIRIAQGFFAAIWWVSMEVQLADLTPPNERSRVMGIYNASWASGFLIGPFLAGIILDYYGFDTYGFKWTFYTAFIVIAVFIPLTLMVARSHTDPQYNEPLQIDEENNIVEFNTSNLIPSWATAVTCGGVLGLIFSLYPVYAKSLQISAFQIGFLLFGYGMARILTFLGANKVILRYGTYKAILGGLSLVMFIFLLGLSSKIIIHILSLVFVGFGVGLAYTSALTIASQTPAHARGRSLGIFEVMFSVGIASFSQIGGILADWRGLNVPYIFAGIIVIISIIGLLIYFKQHPKEISNAYQMSN